jgi:hypothetical protein
MTIPAGALPSDTSISVTESDGALPADYTGLSPLYTFAPDGTVFQKPVTVAFTLANPGTNPTVYWSNASGGYDELPTTVTPTGVTASIAHFSHGFVADKKQESDADAGSDDAGSDDASAPDSSASDSGGSDAGTSGITATIDGVGMTFSANPLVTLGNLTTTIKADENATSTHWTLQVVMTGVPQEMCQPNVSNPTMTYTHYTSGSMDAVYSTKTTQGACLLVLSHNPVTTGDHATGTIMSATLGQVSGPTGQATHTIANGTFDLTFIAPTL